MILVVCVLPSELNADVTGIVAAFFWEINSPEDNGIISHVTLVPSLHTGEKYKRWPVIHHVISAFCTVKLYV